MFGRAKGRAGDGIRTPKPAIPTSFHVPVNELQCGVRCLSLSCQIRLMTDRIRDFRLTLGAPLARCNTSEVDRAT